MKSVEHLYKSYGPLVLFKDLTMAFEDGRITTILGPSGCGKTTLLNIIGGIETPDSGILTGFDDCRFSYIFQEPRLLPWKSVRGNIEFVVNRALTPAQRHDKVEELMNRVNLSAFADYYPSQLSGGMRQRVSIARSFAVSSDVILMDEPLNGLDSALKRTIISWFKQLWSSDPRTVIYVTHDEDEARLLGSSRVVKLKSSL